MKRTSSARPGRLARMPWQTGDVVEWRETWRGRVLLSFRVRVVEDGPHLLAVYLPAGAPFAFPSPWPWGAEHPWQARGRFEGHGVLILHRPGDSYAVWVFWSGAERRFAERYVNLPEPIRPIGDAIITFLPSSTCGSQLTARGV